MMRQMRVLILTVALLAAVTFGDNGPAVAIDDFPVVLTEVAVGFNTPIGMDYSPPFNEIIMSVNWSSGLPHNFERVSSTGVITQFSDISGLTDEVKIAIPRDTLGGFTIGELFTGNGKPGQVARIAPNGEVTQNPWVIFPGETGLLRGGLHVDRTGLYGGDLIVVTNTGGIWRVNSSGVATRLASLGSFLEGVTVAPDDPALGPAAGKIIFNDSGAGKVKAIDALGNVITLISGFPIDQLEDVDFILAEQNFYTIAFTEGKLLGAPAEQFAPFVGQILVTQEFGPGRISALSWNGTAFVLTQLAEDRVHFEHGTFAPMALPIAETVDNTSYSVTYDGWTGTPDSQASGGGFRAALEFGQKITYKTADPTSAITLITYRGPDQGLAQVSIDGVDQGTLDLCSPVPEYQYLVEYSGLTFARHVIAVKVLGQKNPDCTATGVRVDGFQVNAATVEDTDPNVEYNMWINRPPVVEEAYGGSLRHTAAKDASVFFNFGGTQFTWFAARGPAFGLADVIVDGVLIETVDLYNPTREIQYKKVITGLANIQHTVQIKALGTHSGSSTGNRVAFDAYSVP